MNPTVPVARARAAFIFIFFTVLLDMLALGVIVPVLPALVVAFRGGDTAMGASIYGLFATVWAVMQFVCSPILGSLSDRFGRRRVIHVSVGSADNRSRAGRRRRHVDRRAGRARRTPGRRPG